ncbi:MAG: hypothetical protein ABIW80_03120 [Lapillicoccus sp.]
MTSIIRWLLAFGTSLALVLSGSLSANAGPTAAGPGSASAPQRWGASARADSDATADLLGIERSPAYAALASVGVGAINPADYVCGPTDFSAYAAGLSRALTPQERTFLSSYPQVLDIPTVDAILYGSSTDARYDLRSDDRHSLTKTFSTLQRFWDIPSADIQLVAMHGSVLQDPVRVARVLQLPLPGFGLSPAAAQQAAQEIAAGTRGGLLAGGANALLTLNAFAFTPSVFPSPLMQGLPDKMIVGDGIVDAMNALGVGDVGPRVIMAHEFGHHVQYRDKIFASTLPPPEASRRVELMADAFSTYFSVHAHGLSLNTKRVLLAEQAFFDLGDCAYTNPQHHGTPLQRMRSATWAAGVASAARPQGKVLPSLTFAAMFERELPVLVAPDAR